MAVQLFYMERVTNRMLIDPLKTNVQLCGDWWMHAVLRYQIWTCLGATLGRSANLLDLCHPFTTHSPPTTHFQSCNHPAVHSSMHPPTCVILQHPNSNRATKSISDTVTWSFFFLKRKHFSNCFPMFTKSLPCSFSNFKTSQDTIASIQLSNEFNVLNATRQWIRSSPHNIGRWPLHSITPRSKTAKVVIDIKHNRSVYHFKTASEWYETHRSS